MNILNKTKIAGLALLIGASISISQAQETKSLDDFTGIKVGDSFEIILTQGSSNTIKVEGEEAQVSKLKAEVKDGILSINLDGNAKTEDIVIHLEVKNINSIDITGVADLKSKNQLSFDDLTIESSGAGNVNLELKSTKVKVNISGAGDVTLKGTCDVLEVNVSGAGDLKATDFESNKVTAKVSGAGDAKVNAKQALTADVSGAGSIIYKGNPVDRSVNISGVGSVRQSKIGTGEETASDTTKFKLGNKKYMIIGDEDELYSDSNKNDSTKSNKDDFKNWTGFELGVNGFLDYKSSLDVPPNGTFLELDYAKSIQFGLNLLEKDFHLYKNYVNLVVGFGFDFNHYAFKNNITLHGDSTIITASFDDINYKKNKLNVSYIKVPLLLDFNTSKNPNKNFHVSVGAEFAYRIHAVAKQKYDVEDVHVKTKRKDDFNLEPFRYSATARIGYNNVTVFANYGLNNLFKTKNGGPVIYPFTIGVNFSFS